MTEIIILQSPSTQLSSSPSSIPISDNDGLHQQTHESSLIKIPRGGREREEEDQLSLLGVWFTVFRKSLIACSSSERVIDSMEIGEPTNVRHVAHVTFDRFNGFLGLPVEFEPEVSRRPPSASTSVFGVSTKSMQLSFDSRGNSVPTILLMMQRCLYVQGGLQAEGIFRINGENGQEEYIREQLNMGLIPDSIDVHCLAGLIKAWFRELPNGVLDSLSPEKIMQAQSEQECAQLVRHLPPTEAALLDWAINLMADVAQLDNFNKMNARNVAMVFAPNMTQMADPMTALMYVVQVMNFLKTLIVKTLRDREDSAVETGSASHFEPSDENGRNSSSQPMTKEVNERNKEEQVHAHPSRGDSKPKNDTHGFLVKNLVTAGKGYTYPCEVSNQVGITAAGHEDGDSKKATGGAHLNMCKTKYGQSSKSVKKGSRKGNERRLVRVAGEKSRGTTTVSRLNSRTERVEAWR